MDITNHLFFVEHLTLICNSFFGAYIWCAINKNDDDDDDDDNFSCLMQFKNFINSVDLSNYVSLGF